MSNNTFWAIRRRELAKRNAPAEEKAEPAEEVSYRDLQAKAKELDIPANQSREELEAAIDKAD